MQWGEMDWSPLGDGHHQRRRIKRWSTAFFGRTDTRWLYHSRRKFAFFSRQRQYRSQPHKPAINNRTPHTFVIGLLMPKFYQFFVVRLSILCFLSTRFTVDGFLSPTAAAYDQPQQQRQQQQQQQQQQYAHKSFNNSSPPLCPNCLIRRDELRKYTLEEIKLQLLIKLGFTNGTPPNITASKLQTNEEAVVKQLMSNHGAFSTHRNRHKDDTQRIYNEEDDDRLKTTFLAIMGKPCAVDTHCKKWKNHSPVTFVFERKTLQNKIIAARLNFYQKASISDIPFNVSVIKCNARAISLSEQFTTEISIEKKLTPYSRWIEIDMKEPLNKHFRENDVTNISLIIMVSHPNKNASSMLVTEIKKDDDNQFVPFLKIYTEEPKNRRSKRSAGSDCRDDQQEMTCCRYPLTVDFEDFKWDFIIAPKKYEAHYCSGECGMMTALNYPHTHIVQLTPNKRGHVPCCGPRKMAPISMLYYNQHGNIVYAIVPEMVVEKCGCS